MKKAILLLAAMLAMSASVAGARTEIQEFTLFAGGPIDSNATASRWIPIRGASQVTIRTWSTHGGNFLGEDSTFTDSIAVWNTLFSDSHFTIVSDLPVAGDSIVIVDAGVDSIKLVRVFNVPINKELRAPVSGSGRYTYVYPISLPTSANLAEAAFVSSYMRVRITALRRHTGGTWDQTTCVGVDSGCRVNGFKGLRMKAYVVYDR